MSEPDAFILVSHYAFSTFPLSRLIMETNSIAIEQFRSAVNRGSFVEEARLHNYERIGTEWSDLVYLSVSSHVFLGSSDSVVQIRIPPRVEHAKGQ